MCDRKYFLWNIQYFTFSSRARLFHWKEKVYILLGSTLLNTFWQAAEYFRRKIENEIMEKDFVTEENRNQPINRNQSMWMRRNRVDISEEYRVPKCIWIKALGWVYPISNDVEFTIFSILNSFRFTSNQDFLIFQQHVSLPQACTAQGGVHWLQTLCTISEKEKIRQFNLAVKKSGSSWTLLQDPKSPDSCQSPPPEVLPLPALGRWWWWGRRRCWRRRRGRRWSRRCRRWTSQCDRVGWGLGLRTWRPWTAGARQASPG